MLVLIVMFSGYEANAEADKRARAEEASLGLFPLEKVTAKQELGKEDWRETFNPKLSRDQISAIRKQIEIMTSHYPKGPLGMLEGEKGRWEDFPEEDLEALKLLIKKLAGIPTQAKIFLKSPPHKNRFSSLIIQNEGMKVVGRLQFKAGDVQVFLKPGVF